MIQSMTAFVREEAKGEWGCAVWELRSVNHRYLELSLRLPDNFGQFENILRERLRNKLQRGKIDINLRLQTGNIGNQLTLNKDLVLELIQIRSHIAHLIDEEETILLDPSDILRWPGVLQTAEKNFTGVEAVLLESFDLALNQLIQLRQREGAALRGFLEQRLAQFLPNIALIKERFPAILQEQREKILQRLTEAKSLLDPARLEQEMVLFAQKVDVAEEVERLETHVQEVSQVLKKGGAMGRRLDFLLQELNREANTLGAKSVSIETTKVAVELKVLIEQMREQVQNVE